MRFPLLVLSLLTLQTTSVVIAKADPPVDPRSVVGELSEIHTDIESAVEEARVRSDHPLWQRHLDSVLSLVETDIARVRLGYDWNEDQDGPSPLITESLGMHRKILRGLKGDAGQPDFALKEGRLSLVLSFVSKVDRSIQYYSVSLPQGWDETKAYPLITSLHGVGTHHPLGYVYFHFPGEVREKAEGQAAGGAPITSGTDAEADAHITIRPWGRGNNGYTGFGEIDVYEALADLNRRVKTDRSRWYLTGGSMGAAGAWRIAIDRPDLWAAVAPIASSHSSIELDSPAVQNLKGIPFYFQTGSEDGHRVPLTKERAAAVEALGNEVVVEILPGVGHNVPREYRKQVLEWMMQFEKRPPMEFDYQLDASVEGMVQNYIEPWGIDCRQERGAPPYRFSFKYERDAHILHLETENVRDVRFDPAPLQFGSPMQVIWNGKPAYEGPAEKIRLRLPDDDS